MIQITITAEAVEALKKWFEKPLVHEGESKKRRKVYPGENLDVTLAEVQASLHMVESTLGKQYVDIILQRIPAAGIASLKTAEYGRCVRLCQYYLNDHMGPGAPRS